MNARNLCRLLSLIVVALLATAGGRAGGQIPVPTDAPQPLSPEESAARMRLPDGFKIELLASEPLLEDPSCVAFDEHGRLFISELHGYNLEGQLDVDALNKSGELDMAIHRVRVTAGAFELARKQMRGVIKMLKDTDGDGRYDAVDIWRDDLPPCYGIVPARGGIIATCAPDIIYLADRDGDGHAEVRETIFTGFVITVMERAINNPRWGPDNWIYVGEGGGGGTITGPNLKEPFRLGETDFRIKADGSAIEAVNGSVGTFGLAVTDYGDRFIASGNRPADYALPLPYRYLARNPYVPSPRTRYRAVDYDNVFRVSRPHPWRTRRAQDPRWVKFYGKHETSHQYYSASCGNEIYRAALFGEDYRDNVFCCEPSQNIIHRCILNRDGAGYRGRRAPGNEQSEFLASTDRWFRPVNVRVGPDGALYIVDLYREIIEDYSAIPRYLQQQYGLMNGVDRGRLWRLAPDDKPPRPLYDLAALSTDELLEVLDDDEAWWRLTAQRLLIERADRSATAGLVQMVRVGKTPQGRLAALYTLHGIGSLRAEHVLPALSDTSYGVRSHALQLSEPWLKDDERLVAKVASMVNDPDPRARLHVAMTLGAAPPESATTALLQLARKHGSERWMSSAILSSSVDSAGDLFGQLLHGFFDTEGSRALLPPLAATVGGQRDPSQLARLLGAVADQDAELQTASLGGLLQGLSRGNPIRMDTGIFRRSVEKLLSSSNPQVRSRAARVAARLGMHDLPQVQAFFARAAEQALDENARLESRRLAASRLAAAPYAVVAAAAEELLDARQPPVLQTAIVEALSASDDAAVGKVLLAAWKGYTPTIRRSVLRAIFARSNRLPTLLDAIEQNVVGPAELDDFRRRQLSEHPDAEISGRARRLLERESNADAELAARIELYQQALDSPRSPELGREVFVKHCMTCHRVNNEGEQVGPSLGASMNRPDEALVVEMLDPSREIASGYQSYVVTTEDGRIFSGVLQSDSATSITLRRDGGQSDEILRKDIDTIMASKISMMPSNLHEQVKPQDLANLLSYLRRALSGAE